MTDLEIEATLIKHKFWIFVTLAGLGQWVSVTMGGGGILVLNFMENKELFYPSNMGFKPKMVYWDVCEGKIILKDKDLKVDQVLEFKSDDRYFELYLNETNKYINEIDISATFDDDIVPTASLLGSNHKKIQEAVISDTTSTPINIGNEEIYYIEGATKSKIKEIINILLDNPCMLIVNVSLDIPNKMPDIIENDFVQFFYYSFGRLNFRGAYNDAVKFFICLNHFV